MPELRKMFLFSLLPASAYALCLGLTAEAATIRDLPVDRPSSIDGVDVACTGIGQREQNEPRWRDYPVKLEAVGGYGQYLADEKLSVQTRDRAEPLNVQCDAPWILMRLEPGHYRATMSMAGAAQKSIAFTVPDSGQRRVIVRFSGKMAGREHNPSRNQA